MPKSFNFFNLVKPNFCIRYKFSNFFYIFWLSNFFFICFQNSEIINTGFRDESIVWDGFDDFGDKLGKGVYIYRIMLKSKNDGSKVDKFEKLVILH